MTDITIFVAFGAGIISFFAPCVLPLVPGFLAYLGSSAIKEEAGDSVGKKGATFRASIFFVLGFVSVFSLLGLILHGALIQVGPSFQGTMAKIGGGIVIFFGLYLMRIIKIPFLERPHLVLVKRRFSSRALSAFVFGAAFAIGWTPCVGVALAAIFGLAALAPAKTLFLLIAYSLGLGIPFLIIGAFAEKIETYLLKSFTWMEYVNILFGGVLIFVGALAFTQNLSLCREVLWNFPF